MNFKKKLKIMDSIEGRNYTEYREKTIKTTKKQF